MRRTVLLALQAVPEVTRCALVLSGSKVPLHTPFNWLTYYMGTLQ
jgi:hypothetical protein